MTTMSTPRWLLVALFLATMATTLTGAQLVQRPSSSLVPFKVAGLSYEAQDTIVDLMSQEGFRGLLSAKLLARGEPRRIYRKDTGPKYVAYYEILSGDGTEYFLLSAGPKTGDNRFVESGNVTAREKRPTDALNDQAKLNGQACSKHYRLSSAGVYMCENYQGVPVAATYNWTSNAPLNPKEWRSLAAMVKQQLGQFNKEWRELSREVSEEGEWQNIQRVGLAKTPEQFGEEALEPGTTYRVALGFQVKNKVRLAFKTTGGPKSHLKAADWQKRLCSVLLNVCSGRDLTSVSTKTFAVAPNGLHYFLLTVHQDRSHIQKALLNTDISFTIQLTADDGALIEKSFGIETNFTSRTKRWSAWSYWNVPQYWLFPNYNQHSCCGCYSGCGPVAWAQVFAYYDRLAHNGGYGYSQNLFTCNDEVGINWPCVAPWWTPRRYVVSIRRLVDTFCLFGGGATTHWDMTDAKLLRWYRTRQGGGAWLDSHTSWWSTLPGIYRTWIRDRAITDIKSHYPAIVGIWVGSSQHYAVATRYRRRYKRWRICWWFFGWHCTRWFYIWRHEWYLHMGWGSSAKNIWRKSKAFAAFAAKK